ncbi:telomere-protecting terminal protein Tpg [Streptomyces ardesiacus]|uniref:telomere-protecting terminal protein Tpg n=1 Tax=Streptomyces sp. NRRL F-7442 TaxID=1519498 RepID=UPI000A948C14|nr:hypothetical protein [Streptomyces sp. NRRL F-7442]
MAQKRFPAPDGRGADSHGRLTRDSLDHALEGAFTRRIPQTAQALGISVERYVSGKLKRPHQDLRGRLEPEVKKRWQPQIRAKAREKAATKDGLVVSTRACFGFEAAGGTTDDARIRDIT